MKLERVGRVSKGASQAQRMSMRQELGARAGRHGFENDYKEHCLIALDDLLWLRELRTPQKNAVRAKRIPRCVLELFVARGLVERQVSSLRLTPNGERALKQLI